MNLAVERPNKLNSRAFPLGGGEAGALIRSIDWSKTPVGPIEFWPHSLKTALRILLDCKLPMYIAWGREFTQFYNDAYRPILGNKHPAAMGISSKKTWPEIWSTIGPMWEQVWRGQSIGFDGFKLTIDRFGYSEDCYFNFSYSPVPNNDGNVAGVLVTFAETTERVLSEQRLKQEREKLYSVFMQAPVGVCVLEGPEHVFALVNPFWYSILSYGMNREVVGKTVREAQPELKGQGFYELLDRVYQTGEPYTGKSVPIDVVQADGSSKRMYLDFVYVAKRNSEGHIDGILCVFTDVTEQEQAIEKFRTEQFLREQFVSTLTHDLRSPLAAAKISAQLLSRSSNSPDKLAILSGRIVGSLTRASQMIENLLDANRIKAGKTLPLELKAFNLVALVTETLSELTTVVEEDRFVFKSKDMVITGYWSEDGMRRIVENLCTNAVKYGAKGTPVTVSLELVDDQVLIRVHNVGNPIPAEEISNLFDPFKRATTSSQSKGKGWGLGLTLVKGLAEAHGGSVKVESTLNDGTLFTVCFPVETSDLLRSIH